MKKRYEVKGMMEWHPVFAAGRARIRVPFTGGHLGDGCSAPAIFETSDAVIQRVIECSIPFRNGRIRLAASFPQAATKALANAGTIPDGRHGPVCQSAPAIPTEASQPSEIMEFDNFNDAADYLQFKMGVHSTILFDANDCIREAKSRGINMIIKDQT